MKVLIMLTAFGVAIGCRYDRFDLRALGAVTLGVGLVVGVQTFNIVFRYIGVD